MKVLELKKILAKQKNSNEVWIANYDMASWNHLIEHELKFGMKKPKW